MEKENPRVTIAEDLVLDFSALFEETPPGNVQETAQNGAGEPQTVQDKENPSTEGNQPESRVEPQQARQLYLDTRRNEAEHEQYCRILKEYQANIKASSQLQTDILKGARMGEDAYSLLLKAARVISVMTANEVFYTQLKADFEAVYGHGLQYQPALQNELEDTQERLRRLREAYNSESDPDERKRILAAMQAHEQKVKQLESLTLRESKAS